MMGLWRESISLAAGTSACSRLAEAMQAAGGKGSSEMHSSTGHKHIPGCWAIARSGIPPREPLFNGTICRHPGRWGQLAYSRGFAFGTDGGSEGLEVSLVP